MDTYIVIAAGALAVFLIGMTYGEDRYAKKIASAFDMIFELRSRYGFPFMTMDEKEKTSRANYGLMMFKDAQQLAEARKET